MPTYAGITNYTEVIRGVDGNDIPLYAALQVVVELLLDEEPDGAQLRELWESIGDGAGHGVPHVVVCCEGGKAATADVRAALRRFNEAPDDGWRWTTDALAAYLLHELCGIALLDCRQLPSRDD